MSNRRKASAGRVLSQRCSFCGHAAGGLRALHLRGGQVACPRCQERGALQRLACGHYGVPGGFKVNENGDGKTFVCASCATDTSQFGTARLGLRRLSRWSCG